MQSKNKRRRYDDACGIAHGLELIGERWAPLVLRELMFGARRFADLKADLPGITSKVLTQRLAELEERGLVQRRRLPAPASIQVYEATGWGLEAAPVLRVLGRWALRSPRHNPGLPVSRVSLMMSMETMFDPTRVGSLEGRFGFAFGDAIFVAELSNGLLRIWRGPAEKVDALFRSGPEELAAVLYGGAPLETIEVVGDRRLARRFVKLFPLPRTWVAPIVSD